MILLNSSPSPYYEKTKEQALKALRAYSKGLQVGGGITAENAEEYLEAGASHVIVTSYVFKDGEIRLDRLKELEKAVGRKHLVLDVSCRRKGDDYYIVTDRWQTFTNVRLTRAKMEELAAYCDEFLVHGVDVEGKASGVEENLVQILAVAGKDTDYLRRGDRENGRLGSLPADVGWAIGLYNRKCVGFIWRFDTL